jgi:transcriptional regulator GlxA family with amidase domain
MSLVRLSPSVAAALLLAACGPNREIDEFPAKIGIVITEGYFVSEVSAPYDIYAHAGPENAEVFLVAETMDPVVGYYGEILTPDYTFENAPETDVLVVPSGGNSMGSDLENEAYIDYIEQEAKDAAFVTSHCWGAFALAAAGILDKRAATTFPGYTDALAEMFPKIGEIVTTERWVQDEHVITSNGGFAAYEASLQVVEQIFGAELADTVAAGLVFDDANLDYARNPKIDEVPSSSEALTSLPEPKKVAILVMDGLFINEAIGPYDIYAHGGYGENFEVYFVAESMEPIVGYYNEKLTPHYTFADAPQADVLVIPSGLGSMDVDQDNGAMVDWIATQAAGAEYVTSHCWGAFMLAKAGLLDGRVATTFPGYFEDLRTQFPSIATVVEDSRIVRDGNLVTSNGGLAAYEASLYVVHEILGAPADEVIAGGLVFAQANLDNVHTPHVTQ